MLQQFAEKKTCWRKMSFINPMLKKGWITIDLSPHEFSVAKDFYLVFEWIMDKNRAIKSAEHEARGSHQAKMSRADSKKKM